MGRCCFGEQELSACDKLKLALDLFYTIGNSQVVALVPFASENRMENSEEKKKRCTVNSLRNSLVPPQ